MPTNVRDPRTIITPDAFGISPDLLGTPLARPGARFWAMMIDLVVVGTLTAMLGGVGLFVWGVVALLLVRVSLQTTSGRKTQGVSMLLRASAGCLGLAILGGVVLAWLLSGLGEDEPSGPGEADIALEALTDVLDDAGGPGGLDLARLTLESLRAGRSLGAAGTAEEAEAATLRLLSGLDGAGLDREERRELLDEMTPADAPWADQADQIYGRALDRWEASAAAGAAPDTSAPEQAGAGGGTPDSAALGEEIASLDEAGVLEAFAAALRGDTAGGALRSRLLRRRAVEVLTGDTLAALTGELVDLEEELAEEEARRREAERRAAQAGSGFVALLRDVWDQLGSAVGLWSVYFTALLTLFNGQTAGKRLLGIRVVRLDGEPLTLWSSFERAGGYVAGLATGLLGFAQVFWDPNRQCIHDKIIGTVVVDDRAPKVPGSWTEAWADSRPDRGAELEQDPEEQT